jgi:hypothetical protein
MPASQVLSVRSGTENFESACGNVFVFSDPGVFYWISVQLLHAALESTGRCTQVLMDGATRRGWCAEY